MKRTFRKRILAGSMLLFVLISIATNLFTYEINKRDAQRTILEKNMLALTALCNDISKEIVRMQNLASMVLIHPDVYDYIKYCYSEKTLDIPFYDKTQYYEEIQRYFYGMHLYDPTLSSISIIIGGNKLDHFAMRSGISTDSLNLIVNSDWYSTVINSDEPYFLGMHNSYFAKSTDTLKSIEDAQYFSVAKSMRNMTTKDVYGVALCCYDAKVLIQQYSVSLSDEIHTFVIVEKNTGRVLLSNNLHAEGIPEHLKDLLHSDETYRIYNGGMALLSAVNGTDYVIIADIPIMASMYEAAMRVLNFAIGVTVVGICIFFVLAFVYSHRIAKPVNAILDTMRDMEGGNLSARVDETKAEDEFVDIARRLNSMGEQMGILLNEAKQKEREKNEATFFALQMQINPHFICNTLNSIRLMALMHDENEISNMLEATAAILRASFKNTSAYTTLGEDIRLIQAYTSIMRLRYGDVFVMDYQIDNAVLSCRILRFMIQPCVENAILHGIIPKKKAGTITLSAGVCDEKLVVEIRDNGVGTDLNLTQVTKTNKQGGSYNSIGLNNVLSRIQLTYGDMARVAFESKLNEGTRICFYLPIENTEE